ncbi:MAG TPA: SDR family NAD(P)-dependent oxidoreductase [Nocardioides sp.]|uniref:SDR family NAD(P)-dependent oxidoreductase n=1 Tax=Nocardioides sp. TaxID=35761 RepID=UPI002F405896
MRQIDRQVYGPWALVTGASSGIGAEFARQIAASGINVVLVARSQERLRDVATSLQRDHHVDTRTISLDLGQDGILDRIAEATDDLDIGLVVSNAGAGNPGPFISLPLAGLREIVQLNVITHLELAHHFGRRLSERGRGGLVLVSAAAGAGGLTYMANDSATKAYPLSLGEALHEELESAGVDVTVLVPVLVKTPVVDRIGLEAIDLPVDAISAEEAVDEAFTALLEHRPTTIDRERLAPLFAEMKGAVITAISKRLAASRPAH